MTEDRSLDEFAVGGEDGEGGESGDGKGDGEDDADAGDAPDVTDVDTAGDAPDVTDADAADPATSTSTWTSDGAACADCGAVVERRWNADGELVCGDCKSW